MNNPSATFLRTWTFGRVTPCAYVAIFVVACSIAQAQTYEPRYEAFKQEYEKARRAAFIGYQGIAFLCTITPERQFEMDLCKALTEEARFLAAASKTKFVIVKDATLLTMVSIVEELLPLTVKVLATKNTTGTVGIHLAVEVSPHYSAGFGDLVRFSPSEKAFVYTNKIHN